MNKKKKRNIEEIVFKEWLAPEFRKIYVIGVGGTGGYLVAGLCKLIAGYKLPVDLVLVDPDTVEEKNIHRQNFNAWEIGESKVDALAFRMMQQYGMKIETHVAKGEAVLKPRGHFWGDPMETLTICCVDNFQARINMEDFTPILDAGNNIEYGQVIFGTTNDTKDCRREIRQWKNQPNVNHLPTPALKTNMKALVKAPTNDIDCADHPFAEQSVFVNEMAAQAGLVILHQLLVRGRVTTPAIYFDSGKGRMNPAKITKDYFKV